MKNLFVIVLCFVGLLYSQTSNAQSVTITAASVMNVPNNSVVYVAGTLTGVKGIPITGYTIDVVSSDNQTTRVVTNQASSGGAFNYAGAVVIKGNAPYKVKVTTNRQASATAVMKSCSCT